jgi:hypothetical protein
MFNVATLAPILQMLFTSTADELARETGFIKRKGKYSGAQFLQAMVFGYLERRDAPLEALAQPLRVSRQALDQRLDGRAAALCRLALQEATGHLVQAKAEALPLLARFNGTYAEDSTQAGMPDEAQGDFPGCNSIDPDKGKAGMKVLTRFELTRGAITHLGIYPARASEHTAAGDAPPLPEGCLLLRDLGFCDFGRLQAQTERGVYWVSRLPAQARLYLEGDDEGEPLAGYLKRRRRAGDKEVELDCAVGDKDRAHGRLVALRCPNGVVARRLAKLKQDAKRRGRAVSERQREMCHWTVLFTNVCAEWLSVEQVWTVYRLRWQIELLFKRLKSEGGLGDTRSRKGDRVGCEWYAKLLGQVVRNWVQLLCGGPLRDVNAAQVGRTVSGGILKIAEALARGHGLDDALLDIARKLDALRPRTRRRSRRTASQTLWDYELAASA